MQNRKKMQYMIVRLIEAILIRLVVMKDNPCPRNNTRKLNAAYDYDSKINQSKSDKTSCHERKQLKKIHVLGIIR